MFLPIRNYPFGLLFALFEHPIMMISLTFHRIYLYLACTYLDTGITAGDSGVTLKASKDFLAYMEVVGIQSSPIEEVGGLDKLRSEQMLSPVHLKIRRKSLRNEIVALYDLIEDFVTLDGRFKVAHKDLQTRPECT